MLYLLTIHCYGNISVSLGEFEGGWKYSAGIFPAFLVLHELVAVY